MISLPVVRREYDQVLTGDVKIEKISHGNSDHIITFSKQKISTILIYQVLSKSNTLNQNREINELKATEWVKLAFSNPAFTPTTVMKLQYGECPFHHKKDHCDKYAVCRHVFVINRAKVNKYGQVVFYVSSDVMTLPPKPNKYLQSLKLTKKIPTTKCNKKFHNVQFAIDDSYTSVSVIVNSYSGTIPSNFNSITTGTLSVIYNSNILNTCQENSILFYEIILINNNLELTNSYYIIGKENKSDGSFIIYFFNSQVETLCDSSYNAVFTLNCSINNPN
jgi:hypothetical protein